MTDFWKQHKLGMVNIMLDGCIGMLEAAAKYIDDYDEQVMYDNCLHELKLMKEYVESELVKYVGERND